MNVFVIAAVAPFYAAALWAVARRAATVREVELGQPPVLVLAAAVCVAGAIVACGAGSLAAVATGATLIGATVAAVFDARTGLIPDDLSAATAATALLAAAAGGVAVTAVAGAVACGGALLTLYLITRRRGIGFGDVKLAAALGAGLGPAHGLIAIGAAFVIGAAFALAAVFRHRASRGSSVRFGPYLALGAGCAPALALWLLP